MMRRIEELLSKCRRVSALELTLAPPYIQALTSHNCKFRPDKVRLEKNYQYSVVRWKSFIRMFERLTELCGFSEAQNLLRLQRALIGEAKESVGYLLLLSDGLNEVMETLEVQFGRPDQIIEAMVEKVRRMPAPNPGCLRSLEKFGFSVRNMCATIEALKLPEYAYDVALLRELVLKLLSEAALDWARYKRQLRFVSLSEFGHWISQLARDASDAIVDPPSRNANEQRISTGRRQPSQDFLCN